MNRWTARYVGEIIAVLLLIIGALLLANLNKPKPISSAWLKENKDAIDAATKLCQTGIFLIGAAITYFTFFRGRAFTSRLDLKLDVAVHYTPSEVLLHAVRVEVKNIGTKPIWDPKATVGVSTYGESGFEHVTTVEEWIEPESCVLKGRERMVIECGETITFLSHVSIPKSAWAVAYFAVLNSEDGGLYRVATSISNEARSPGAEAGAEA